MIPFGSPEFWKFYDEFCKESNIAKLNHDPNHPMASQMQEITAAAHRTREIHDLTRPERHWGRRNAWLVLKTTEIPRYSGEQAGFFLRAGDVIVEEHQWDRDVIITHVPVIRNMVSGYLLSGKWECMVGLFMPLFDGDTIAICIKARLDKNLEDAWALAHEEAEEWKWYLT